MDGRGRWMDNVFSERLWRSLKCEGVYLKSYADGREAYVGCGVDRECQESCARGRVFHQALTKRSPNVMANWVFASAHSRGGIFHC